MLIRVVSFNRERERERERERQRESEREAPMPIEKPPAEDLGDKVSGVASFMGSIFLSGTESESGHF